MGGHQESVCIVSPAVKTQGNKEKVFLSLIDIGAGCLFQLSLRGYTALVHQTQND